MMNAKSPGIGGIYASCGVFDMFGAAKCMLDYIVYLSQISLPATKGFVRIGRRG